MARWCSRLARQPVTLEVDGSSPFRVAILKRGDSHHPTYASVAQLVEQRTENPRVVGSTPTGGTICGCSSSGRAPPCQGGGSEFEPRHPLQTNKERTCVPYFIRCHSQVVRQRSAKPSFPGSNPGGTSIKKSRNPFGFCSFRLFVYDFAAWNVRDFYLLVLCFPFVFPYLQSDAGDGFYKLFHTCGAGLLHLLCDMAALSFCAISRCVLPVMDI